MQLLINPLQVGRVQRPSGDDVVPHASAGSSLFPLLFEHSPEAIALVRVHDGVLLHVNAEWRKLTGHTRDEAVGRTEAALGLWLDPQQQHAIFHGLTLGARVMDVDVPWVLKDGIPRVVRLNATHLEDAGEHFFLTYVRDVTAHELAREALKAGERALQQANETLFRQVKLHELTESLAKVGHWMALPNDKHVQISRGLATMAGLGDVSLTTMDTLWRGVHPEDVPRLQQARAKMDGSVVEFRWVARDGRTLWARSRTHRQRVDGRVVADFGAVQEFTEEHHAREAVQKQLDFIHKITSRAPGVVYECQVWPDGRFTFPFMSAAVVPIFGITMEEVRADANTVMRRIHRDDVPKVVRTAMACSQSMLPWTCEFRTRASPEDTRWLLGSAVPQAKPDGSVLFTGFITDITPQKRALAQLQESEERFRSLSSLSSDWYWEQDAEFRFVRIDAEPVYAERLGFHAALGRTRWDVGLWQVSPAQWTEHMRVLYAHETFQDFEMHRTLPDGTCLWVSISGTPIIDGQGQFCGYRGTGRDISSRKAAETEIERLAFFDALTTLPNRRMLIDRLEHALQASERNGMHGALLFIDLDNFKILNDTLGHHMGDMLLQQVALRLKDCVRSADTVARLGGDEFVVMLEELDADPHIAASQADVVAKKVLTALNREFVLGGHHLHSSPSIGVTLFFRHAASIEELLKRADLAMYQSKGAGRNTVRFFDPEMQAAASERAGLEAALRTALHERQFVLHYQPVVDPAGAMTGVEALLRWQHPTLGTVAPGTFVPVAEQTGLIVPLGQWVLEAACAQLVAWSADARTEKLSIAVNVSARQFHHPEFCAQILGLLHASGANPYRLKLEITESLLLTDFDDTARKMGELRAIGVTFSLDDFGTGYSSLAYLKRLPLDQLKIDRSFVRDVLTDPNDAAIARTILSLAKSLDLVVVAEGVETQGQRDFLFAEGCHFFQGYFFGHPVPVEQLRWAP